MHLDSLDSIDTAARQIAAQFTPEVLAVYPTADGVTAFLHGTVCGIAGSGDGFTPAPTARIATNSEMYGRRTEDTDVNAGRILSEGVSFEQVERESPSSCSTWPQANTRNRKHGA